MSTGARYVDDTDFTALACVEWRGYKARDGYGRINRHRWPSPQLAHRYIYEECFGHLAPGEQIDHLCENHACVNPFHLRVRETDGDHKRAHALRRTKCRRGHDYGNDGYTRADGRRYCRACERDNRRRRAAVH